MTNNKINEKNQLFYSNSYRSQNKHNFWEDSSDFNNVGNIYKESEYSTLNLIEDLKKEIQKYPEILSRIFPSRYKYNHRQFSLFWRSGKNVNYVSKLLAKVKNERNFALDEKDLNLLEQNLRRKLCNRAINCYCLLKEYKDSNILLKMFIEMIELELGKITGDIEVTYRELSTILGKHEDYAYHMRKYILSQNNRRYNPNYKFDKETLKEFKENLKIIFRNKASNSISFIDKYIQLNPDLNEYLYEKVTIKDPHFFKYIDSEKKAYWFGFLCADVKISGKKYAYMIRLELATFDRERLIRFAKAIGFDVERIRDRIRWYYDNNGDLKLKRSSYIQFKSKSMVQNLLKNGLSTSASNRGLPNFVWDQNNPNLALAFLLGFYDGDGSYFGGYSAEIYSSNKEILIQIKRAFQIEYLIRKTKDRIVDDFTGEIIHRAAYRITLGAKLFEKMIKSYNGSMKRKRPLEL